MLIESAVRGQERWLLIWVNAFFNALTDRFGMKLYTVPSDPIGANTAVETILGGEDVVQWLLQGAVNDSRRVQILMLVPKVRQDEARWADFKAVVRRIVPKLNPKPAVPHTFISIDVSDPDAEKERAAREDREAAAGPRYA